MPRRNLLSLILKGTVLTDENLPIFGGATVKLAFHQYGYGLSNIYGTKLDLTHVQVVSLNAPAGMDTGSMRPMMPWLCSARLRAL